MRVVGVVRAVLVTGGGEVDVDVAVHDPAATAADLIAALGRSGLVAGPRRPGDGLCIDGVPVPGRVPLTASGLRPGCELAPAGDDASRSGALPPGLRAELLVVGGVAAGSRHELAPGGSTVGRDPRCDVVLPTRTTSGRHARLDVEFPGTIRLADAGSTSGTWIDGQRITAARPLPPAAVAAVGATLVRVAPPAWREPAVLGPSATDGRRPLHRPPPPVPLLPPAAVTPPTLDRPPVETARFGWAAALVPLVGGLVLARLVDPRLALFTLLGPAVLVGQWVEDRRRGRRRGADAAAARRVDLAAFAADVEEACAAEGRRRRAAHPDPAAVGQEIDAVGCGLWSRRPGRPAFCEVSVGTAPALVWSPPPSRAAEAAAAAVLMAARLPPGCPATVALAPGGHLGIAGPRSAALAVARWVVIELAAHHGPADLRLAVVCDGARSDDWRWAAFLPHNEAPGASGRLLAAGPAQAAEVAELVVGSCDPAHLVVVVDGDSVVEAWGPVGALAARGATVTIGSSRRALPGRCTSVLELDGPDGWGHVTSDGGAQALLATGIDARTARAWARRLAPLADPEAVAAGCAPPAAARLLDLLGLDRPTPEQVGRRWADRRGAAFPLGCTGGASGAQPVVLDLVADGPHMLVAGTTGAGKSELLRSLVAGLAASSPPDRLALLLVDYKGGAAFAEAAGLPHVVGLVTDLGPDEASRALHSLEAELRRRETVLAELGLRDLADHPAHGAGPGPPGVEPLPRLVVVVDELAALVAELPSFLDGLVQLAARGRSLGLHLVLATQRPGSVVSASVRTNCAVRCCLRVPDEADAVDVVGSPAPAHLDRRQPGRAFLRRGAGDLAEVQVALVGGRRSPACGRVSVGPATFGPHRAASAEHRDGGPTDLALLVDACRGAAAASDTPAPHPLWLPPLPSRLSAAQLPPVADDVVLGLIDDPAHQRRLPLAWRPDDGALLALGSGPGPALALQVAARSLAARLDPGRLHVYGLDLAAQGLSTLAGLPHVGAVLRPGEHERLHRLVQRLADELAARQAAVHDPDGQGQPLVLVLIDGLGGLRSSLDGSSGLAALDALERVVVDGPGLGLLVAATADRLGAVPPAWAAAANCRLAFRGGDPVELLALGANRVDQSSWPDGRCLDLSSHLVAQVATGGWPDPVEAGVPGRRRGPEPVTDLARHITLKELLVAAPPTAGVDGLRLPVGVDGRRLDVAVARLRPGQPFLVCGPPGSGRTTALATVTAAARRAGCEVVGADALADRLASRAGRANGPPLVVAVDDAERVADPDGALAELARGGHPGAHLVAAVPPDAVRSAFGHWTVELRRAGAGLVLRPRSELDADVLGVPLLPRWPLPLSAPGRGVLVVEGEPAPVQVAVP